MAGSNYQGKFVAPRTKTLPYFPIPYICTKNYVFTLLEA